MFIKTSSNSSFFSQYCHYSTLFFSSHPNPQFFSTAQNPSLSLPSSASNPPPTFYDPYASLHPAFYNYPLSSSQLHTLPPNPLPPSISTVPFNPPPQPPLSVSQMSHVVVPLAALYDLIKHFDGLDHTVLLK